MSFPPTRPPMVPGMPPMGMPFMGMPGMPPGMPVGIPPPMMGAANTSTSGAPVPYYPPSGGGPRPGMLGGPPPSNMMNQNSGGSRQGRHSGHMKSFHKDRDRDSQMNIPASMLQPPQNLGPPVPVFVGNITDKWPDAMIRQLLATCGQVLHWKRVQGASGKLQGFGFCDFNGPDAGLRAVRLLHDLEVGDKKLVVKVDAKTSTVLDEFKSERRKRKAEDPEKKGENGETDNGDGNLSHKKEDMNTNENDGEINEDEDYMDVEMKEADEKSRARIAIIFREFKNELESYQPPGDKNEKESGPTKGQVSDKLHLLKLSSLEKAGELAETDDFPEDLALEEGKREIITREISNFREHMKQEKQKEEERKKLFRERREREKAREERRKEREERERSPIEKIRRNRSRSPSGNPSPVRSRRSRSRTDDGRRDGRRDRDDRDRSRERTRDRDSRDIRERDKRRRSRTRRSRSASRERSPVLPPKPRYREREEEEEAAEQKRIERRAREKEAAYEERLRVWETREAKKAKEIRREKDKIRRQDEEQMREAKRMKQFLEDYDDEKYDSKYYKGKELQRRIAERAKELEADNKDRQREREELEEMKLRMLTSNSSSPGGASMITRFDKYKKPMTDSTNTSLSSTPTIVKGFAVGKSEPTSSIGSRLQALAGGLPVTSKTATALTSQNNGHSPVLRQTDIKKEVTATAVVEKPGATHSSVRTSFDSIQFKSFVPVKSNPATPVSIPTSPAVPQMSPSVKSLTGTGFQLTINPGGSKDREVKDVKEPVVNPSAEDSRTSFSPGHSGGMPSPGNSRDFDDFSNQGISPIDAPKKKRIDVKDVFNQDEDDNDGLGSARKRKLVPIDFGDESKKAKKEDKIPEDKKKHIKSLIDKIPTDKEALFAHEIDWEMLDTSLMEKRIRPWINKKIIDYIGEPEPTLVEFICSKVLGRSSPQSILDDVMMVLDDEAEVFVVKMWRLLVYEIAAKKYGLSNKPQ